MNDRSKTSNSIAINYAMRCFQLFKKTLRSIWESKLVGPDLLFNVNTPKSLNFVWKNYLLQKLLRNIKHLYQELGYLPARPLECYRLTVRFWWKLQGHYSSSWLGGCSRFKASNLSCNSCKNSIDLHFH